MSCLSKASLKSLEGSKGSRDPSVISNDPDISIQERCLLGILLSNTLFRPDFLCSAYVLILTSYGLKKTWLTSYPTLWPSWWLQAKKLSEFFMLLAWIRGPKVWAYFFLRFHDRNDGEIVFWQYTQYTYYKLSIHPWIGRVSCDTNPWVSNSLVLLGSQGRVDHASFCYQYNVIIPWFRTHDHHLKGLGGNDLNILRVCERPNMKTSNLYKCKTQKWQDCLKEHN